MSTDLSGFAFISLLRDELEARALSGLLESMAQPMTGVTSRFLVPDIRGRDFFAARARQAEVDRWWRRHMPSTSVPVYLLCHEAGLADWLPGLDGVFFVAARRDLAAEYASWSYVEAEPAQAPLALAEAAVEKFSAAEPSSHPSVAHVFDRRDARLVADLRLDANLPPDSRSRFAPLLHVDGVRTETIASRFRTPPEATFRTPPEATEQAVLGSTAAEQLATQEQGHVVTPGARSSPLRTRLPMLVRRYSKRGQSPSGEGQGGT